MTGKIQPPGLTAGLIVQSEEIPRTSPVAEMLGKTAYILPSSDMKHPARTFHLGHKDRHCRNATVFLEFVFQRLNMFHFSKAGKSIVSVLLPCLRIFAFSLQYF